MKLWHILLDSKEDFIKLPKISMEILTKQVFTTIEDCINQTIYFYYNFKLRYSRYVTQIMVKFDINQDLFIFNGVGH